MKKTLLSLALATTITLPVVSFANNDSDAIQAGFDRGFGKTPVKVISATANKFDPWNQLVNVVHEYRGSSDLSGAIWASLEYGFDKKTDFDPWNQLVNVAGEYRGGSGAIWASFERDFDSSQDGVNINVARAHKVAPTNLLTQNVWTHHLITGVGFTTKI